VACLKKERPLDYSASGVDKQITEMRAELKDREDSLKNTSKELASHEVHPPLPPLPWSQLCVQPATPRQPPPAPIE
jgi:hypothetical protein